MFSFILLIIATDLLWDATNAANSTTKWSITNDYWCYRAKYCRPSNDTVCTRDVRLKQAQWFQHECAVFTHNCKTKTDFTVTSAKVCNTYTPTTTTTTTRRRTRKTRTTRETLPTFVF